MSQRFLKYETEVENGMVDENGVLVLGADAMTIIEVNSDKIVDATIGDKILELVRTGKSFCIYWNGETGVTTDTGYYYPILVKTAQQFDTSSDVGWTDVNSQMLVSCARMAKDNLYAYFQLEGIAFIFQVSSID